MIRTTRSRHRSASVTVAAIAVLASAAHQLPRFHEQRGRTVRRDHHSQDRQAQTPHPGSDMG